VVTFREIHRVRLPFLSALDPKSVIGSSCQGALKRRCISRQEYLELGQMEKVLTQPVQTKESGYSVGALQCYWPHHPVIKESSTKARIVFDGSIKTKSIVN